MSQGLTSYPRTGGGGGSSLLQVLTLLESLRSSSNTDLTQSAQDLVRALAELSEASKDHQSMVQLATEIRNAIFAAKIAGWVQAPVHAAAMEICARHWRQIYSLASTGLHARALHAATLLVEAQTTAEVRAAQEIAGTVAWLYEVSALLGEDISVSHLSNALPLGHSAYCGAYTGSGDLRYLECASSYNINQFVRVDIPGSELPLIIVGEAKGGLSGYGQVSGPKVLLKRLGQRVVSQRDPLYAVTRAEYMRKDVKPAAQHQARRQAGQQIVHAYNRKNFMYLTSRGRILDGQITSQREVFICR